MADAVRPGRVGRGLALVRWWVREFSGSSAYDKYLARHAIEHPDHAPLSAREFWRRRDDDAEHSVSTGCC